MNLIAIARKKQRANVISNDVIRRIGKKSEIITQESN